MKLRKIFVLSALICLIMILSVIGLFAYHVSCNKTAALMRENNILALNNVANEINGIYAELTNVYEYFRGNSSFQNSILVMNNESISNVERNKAFNSVIAELSIIGNNTSCADYMFIRLPSGYNLRASNINNIDLRLFETPSSHEFTIHYSKETGKPQYCTFRLEKADVTVYIILRNDLLASCIEGYPILLLKNDNIVYDFSDAMAQKLLDREVLINFASSGLKEQGVRDTQLYKTDTQFDQYTLVYVSNSVAFTSEYKVILLIQTIAFIVALFCSILFSTIISRYTSKRLRRIAHTLSDYHTENSERSRLQIKNHLNIRETMTLFLIVSVLIPTLLFIGIQGVVINDIYWRHSYDITTASATNTAKALSRSLEKDENNLTAIAYSSDVVSLLSSKTIDETNLSEIMQQFVWQFGLGSWVEITDIDKNLIYTSNSAMHHEEVAAINSWRVFNRSDGMRVIALTLPFRDVQKNNRLIGGYVTLIEGFDWFTNSVMPSRESGIMISDKVPKGYSICIPIRKTSLNLYATIEKTATWPTIVKTYQENLGNLAIITIFVILYAFVVSLFISRPLKRIGVLFQHFEPGDPTLRADKSSFVDETSIIAKSFNDMADRIDALIEELCISNDKNLVIENKKRNAEILALQMQINPHFLTNTIETISGIMKRGEADRACKMLNDLNTLFRTGISRVDYVVSVADELEYVHSYIDIMTVRYPGVTYEWEIDDKALSFETIHLILQPVIENAIYHGIDRTTDKGVIIIRVRKEKDALIYEIIDNGAGIAEPQLHQLQVELEDAQFGKLVGLFNVQARIRLRYGDLWGITITSIPGDGTKVTIRLPAIKFYGRSARE